MPHVDSSSRSEVETTESTGPEEQRFPLEVMFLATLVTAAFLVRLWPLWQVHFWDEAVYLQNAEVICCGKTNYSELSSRPPLLSLMFAGLFRLWHHVYAASIFTAALNALGPLLLFVAGRRLVGKTGAAIAALLLAFSPFFVSSQTGNSLLTDSPALTLILVSFWLLIEAVEGDSNLWSGLAGAASAFAVLMRFASLPTVAILSLLLLRSQRWFRTGLSFAAGFVLGFGPYLLWSKIRYGGLLATLQRGWENVAGSAEPAAYYLQNFGVVFPWITLVGLLLWPFGWWFGRRGERQHVGESIGEGKHRIPAAFLWGWALMVLAYFSALTHKELRYIVPLAAPLFLLAGQGLKLLLPETKVRAARAAGALILGATLAYSFAPDLGRFRSPLISPFISEEKEVSDFVNTQAQPGAVLYTNFNYPVFGYYTHLPTHVLLEQGAAFYAGFPGNMPADGFLVVYKDLDKDPRPDWVESDPHFQQLQDFPSLIVYRYHFQ